LIKGTTLHTYTGNAISAVGVVGGDYYDVTIVVDSTTGMTTDHWLGIKSKVARRHISGFWKIQSVPDGTHVQVRVYAPILAVTTLNSVDCTLWLAPTIIETLDANGFELFDDHVTISQMTVVKSTDGVDAFLIKGTGDCQIGPYVGCTGYVDGSGIVGEGGYFKTSEFYASEGFWGARVINGCGFHPVDSVFSGLTVGMQTYASSIWLNDCMLTNQDFSGISCYQGSAVLCEDCAFIANNIGIWENYQSFCKVTAADGNTFAANGTDLTPAANTEGNFNSYMVG